MLHVQKLAVSLFHYLLFFLEVLLLKLTARLCLFYDDGLFYISFLLYITSSIIINKQ